jgi:hypothetical protein
MSSRTSLPLLLALAVLLLANAVGAAAHPTGTTKADLSTNNGVAAYLKSKGFDPAGFVIQRGSLNYAGTHCPGRSWNCTKRKKVVQLGAGNHGKNVADCEPNGTMTKTANSGATTVTCVVVQSATSGKNDARCSLGAREKASVVLDCRIEQTNVNGDNVARVKQRSNQDDGANQRATLNSLVRQTNGAGDNRSDVKQTIDQSSHDVAMVSVPTQNQEGRFSGRVEQSSETGSNVSNLAQKLHQSGKASGGSNIVQRQFGDHFGDVDQTNGSVEDANARSKSKSKAKSKSFSRSQAHQSEHQRLKGPGEQIQIGPQFCCSTQLGGDDKHTQVQIRQDSKQTASQDDAEQSISLTGKCTTVGDCGIRHSARNDEDSIKVRERCSGTAEAPCTLFVQTTCGAQPYESLRYLHNSPVCVSGDETPSTTKRRR